MSSDKTIAVVDGVIAACLPKTEFNVKIDHPDYEKDFIIRAHLSGKMRLNYIKILPGDKVKVELNPYDLGRGRIVYRYKETEKFSRPKPTSY